MQKINILIEPNKNILTTLAYKLRSSLKNKNFNNKQIQACSHINIAQSRCLCNKQTHLQIYRM